jgi:hypothetical protein
MIYLGVEPRPPMTQMAPLCKLEKYVSLKAYHNFCNKLTNLNDCEVNGSPVNNGGTADKHSAA